MFISTALVKRNQNKNHTDTLTHRHTDKSQSLGEKHPGRSEGENKNRNFDRRLLFPRSQEKLSFKSLLRANMMMIVISPVVAIPPPPKDGNHNGKPSLLFERDCMEDQHFCTHCQSQQRPPPPSFGEPMPRVFCGMPCYCAISPAGLGHLLSDETAAAAGDQRKFPFHHPHHPQSLRNEDVPHPMVCVTLWAEEGKTRFPFGKPMRVKTRM